MAGSSCLYCLRAFPTSKGYSQHLSTDTSCRAKHIERLSKLVLGNVKSKQSNHAAIHKENPDISVDDCMEGIEMVGNDMIDHMEVDDTTPAPMDMSDNYSGLEPVDLDLGDVFHFIPPMNAHPQASDAPLGQERSARHHRALEENNSELYEVVHESAGKVIRVDASLHAMYQDALQSRGKTTEATKEGEDFYSPFHSELDWRVARWAIMEGIGQGSLDRLLAIPGVCFLLLLTQDSRSNCASSPSQQVQERLGLSFNTSRKMNQHIDGMPCPKGGWITEKLAFEEAPGEVYTIHYRNVIDVIRGLWGDPKLAQHMCYKPAKVWTRRDKRTRKRIYREMWTGKWWHAIQVSPTSQLVPVVAEWHF
jgi:hypothetical protein